MNVLFIISTDDGETVYNAMRLADVAVTKGDEVSVFMLGKGVLYEKSSNEQFNVILAQLPGWMIFMNCQWKRIKSSLSNVDEVTKELKAKGVVFETGPIDRSEWGIRTAHFRDPDGNLIEINQPLK